MIRNLPYPAAVLLGFFSLTSIAVAQDGAPAAKAANLYERVSAVLAKRPDLSDLGKPPAEMRQVNWMLGTWQIEASVAADPEKKVDRGTSVVTPVLGGVWLQSVDNYPSGTQDLGMLSYNRVTRQWVNTLECEKIYACHVE